MQEYGVESSRPLTRSIAFGVALLCLVFLLQVAPHGHANNQDEAACRYCQAAHVSATPALSGIVLSAPMVPVAEVAAPIVVVFTEILIRHADSRGPPFEN